MGKNNLQVINTGLDYCYVNGVPIVEAEISIADVYKKISRISSLAVQADPYFARHTAAQKLFSESHGEGDRITKDFLEEGARDLLSMFIPYQRWIPEGTYNSSPVEYDFEGKTADFSWTNPDPTSIFVNSILVTAKSGVGDITFIVDAAELGTVTIPETHSGTSYLAYDIAGYLGGAIDGYYNYSHRENVRNNNMAQLIELGVSANTSDFVYDIKICAVKYDAVGWIKALTQIGDVSLPTSSDDIIINYLIKDFTWINRNLVKASGVSVKGNTGSAYVTISYNDIPGVETFVNPTISFGDDYSSISDDITSISITIRDASDDFNYDLVINTEIPNLIPSPRFEFDSSWNEGKIIFRYQNMDTRINKLDYSPNTLQDTRIDPNTFEEVLKYLKDSLKNYVLKELYLAIGYDKKAAEYSIKYENSRSDTKYWLRSEKGLQTSNYAGV